MAMDVSGFAAAEKEILPLLVFLEGHKVFFVLIIMALFVFFSVWRILAVCAKTGRSIRSIFVGSKNKEERGGV